MCVLYGILQRAKMRNREKIVFVFIIKLQNHTQQIAVDYHVTTKKKTEKVNYFPFLRLFREKKVQNVHIFKCTVAQTSL